MDSCATTLDMVSWGDVVKVRIHDVAQDKFGGLYVRQTACAYPKTIAGRLIDVVRTASGYTTKIDAEDIRCMFGENVFPISAPVDFNIMTKLHKLKSKK